jgi:hypothetical protein
MAGLELLATSQALPSQDIIDKALITKLVVPYFFQWRKFSSPSSSCSYRLPSQFSEGGVLVIIVIIILLNE